MGLTLISHTPTASLLELTAMKEMTAIRPPQNIMTMLYPNKNPLILLPAPKPFKNA